MLTNLIYKSGESVDMSLNLKKEKYKCTKDVGDW